MVRARVRKNISAAEDVWMSLDLVGAPFFRISAKEMEEVELALRIALDIK